MTKTSTLPAPKFRAAGEDQSQPPARAETDDADAVVDVGAGPQEAEAALQVADGLGVGAGVESVAGPGHVGMFHHGQEPVAAVQGRDDGGIAQGGVAAGHVLHVFFVAVDAVYQEQPRIRAALGGPGNIRRHRVVVVAVDGDVVGDYVCRVVDHAGRQDSGNQSSSSARECRQIGFPEARQLYFRHSAKAGIQKSCRPAPFFLLETLDSGFRRNDGAI